MINDETLAKYLLGENTPEELIAVERWIKESPANRQQLEILR